MRIETLQAFVFQRVQKKNYHDCYHINTSILYQLHIPTIMASNSNITLLPAIPSDVPTLASVSHASFEKDAHTRFKTLYGAYNHGEVMTDPLKYWVRCDGQGILLKAITPDNTIVGWAAFKFVNFSYNFEDSLPSPPPNAPPKQEKHPTLPPPPEIPLDSSKSKIEQLGALTSNAMSHYSTLLTPPSSQTQTKCLILLALNILPSHQGLGIGSSLIKWGTDLADAEGAYSWVSSSHDGYRVFEKAGYVEVGRLSVRLDDFVEEGEWGEYVWRYLRRGVGSG